MSTSNMENDITIMEEEQQINQNNVDTLNNITNKLLLKYDSDFQHKYNTTNDLNSGIMNKEELIKMNIDGSHQKDKIISCLKYGIVFLIIFSITFVLFGMKKWKLIMVVTTLINLINHFII